MPLVQTASVASGAVRLLAALLGLLPLVAVGAGLLPGSGPVSLAWDENPEPGVAGYRLHFGTASGDYGDAIDAGKSLQVELAQLQPGQTYYCAATAYDSFGLDSAFSNEVVFTCPLQAPYDGPFDRLVLLDSLAPVPMVMALSIGQGEAAQPAPAGWWFEAPIGGRYVVWCRVLLDGSPGGVIDLAVDGGAGVSCPVCAPLDLPAGGAFWVRMETGAGSPMLLNLTAGAHLLRASPAPGTLIERIVLSSDPGFVPPAELPASGDAVALTVQPPGRTLEAGSPTTLSARAVGTGILYFQWFKDGQPIPGETEPDLTLLEAQPADSGVYAVEVWSGAASVRSCGAVLQVGTGPPPLRITGMLMAADRSSLTFHLLGGLESSYSIFVSEDLAHWSWIGDRVNHNGTITVEDPAVMTKRCRYYRLGLAGGK